MSQTPTDDMVEAARFTLSGICGFEVTAQAVRKALESALAVAPAPAELVMGRPEGHCDSDTSWKQFSNDYGNLVRADLCKGEMTDFALANAQFMCDRNSLDLIVYQTAAKERIRWLSIQLARALATTEGSTDG